MSKTTCLTSPREAALAALASASNAIASLAIIPSQEVSMIVNSGKVEKSLTIREWDSAFTYLYIAHPKSIRV